MFFLLGSVGASALDYLASKASQPTWRTGEWWRKRDPWVIEPEPECVKRQSKPRGGHRPEPRLDAAEPKRAGIFDPKPKRVLDRQHRKPDRQLDGGVEWEPQWLAGPGRAIGGGG